MRLNRFVAQATGMSRRDADGVISQGRVKVNGAQAQIGQVVDESTDEVKLDGKAIALQAFVTILLNKPVGYVVSREGQGSKTIYDILPPELHHLKPIGRLDKETSGLLLLSNDGTLAAELTHPRYEKEKNYEVILDRPLTQLHQIAIEKGIELEDGPSSFRVRPLKLPHYSLPATHYWRVTLAEGRNRQIRRTFESLGYRVKSLHRTSFGPYQLADLKEGTYKTL